MAIQTVTLSERVMKSHL